MTSLSLYYQHTQTVENSCPTAAITAEYLVHFGQLVLPRDKVCGLRNFGQAKPN
jgi:hypothetical protein